MPAMNSLEPPGPHRDDQAEPVPEPAVRVLFFAGAREMAGTAEAVFPWAGLSLATARQSLTQRYGADFERLLASCAMWVNAQPAKPEKVLAPGDEVAVLPPVSGG